MSQSALAGVSRRCALATAGPMLRCWWLCRKVQVQGLVPKGGAIGAAFTTLRREIGCTAARMPPRGHDRVVHGQFEYAMRRPPGLQAAVLSSPLISTERWIADNTAYREQLPEDVRQTMREQEKAGTIDSEEYRDAVMVFYRRHLNRQEPWPAELNKSFDIYNPKLYETMWGPTEFNATGTLKDYDSTGRLPKIEVPALFVCGEHDESTPAANEDFASMTPNGEVKVIDDASHTAFLEQRQRFMTAVREFLARKSVD